MGKRMTLIEDGTVVNLLWCSHGQGETEALKDPADRPVRLGDTYENGKWYRQGGEVLTPLDQARAETAALQQALAELDSAYVEGVNSI